MAKTSDRSWLLKREFTKDTALWATKFFGIAVVAKALCEDGKVRTIRLRQRAYSSFDLPGRATFSGKTLTGFVTREVEPETNAVYLKFTLDMKG